jgi:hypothetical protein
MNEWKTIPGAVMHWLQFPPEKPNTQVHSPGSYSIVSYTCLQCYEKKNCILCSSVADPGCLSRIPDPIFSQTGYRIRTLFPSQICIKEFKYFYPEKWFLSTRKYDPGCSSRIRILTFYPSRIQDPGSRDKKGTGSWMRIRNTALFIL